jgi:acylphosphatase
LHGKDRELNGWALNVSRGGVRVILEAQVELGEEFEVTLTSAGSDKPRRGRVVWVQEEPDGMIAGVAFLDADGDPEPPPFP